MEFGLLRAHMNKPRPITDLLDNQSADPWVRAIQRGKKLQQLSLWVQTALDPDLGSHCEVLNLRGNILILATDATVWATRLRYQLPTLLNVLQQHPPLKGLCDIQIRVKPLVVPPSAPRKHRMTLSDDSAHCLQQCAAGINDTALSQALQRLAERRRG
jgi:hypothetical protein